ncbi:MAG: hypothetical protein IJ341_11745 [Bacteroidales bacterium]|nr:hypothetical protein [Bacteroidales bacterium]
MTDSERIVALKNFTGLNFSKLAKEIGLNTVQTLYDIKNGKHGISKEVADKIQGKYLNINIEWLLTGKGEMFISEGKLVNKISTIPLVDGAAIAGEGNYNFGFDQKDIKELYVIPQFSGADFMIEITGDSMEPTYKRGDIVACSIIKELTFIQWNRCHIITTEQRGSLCKRLMPSDKKDHIQIISDNPAYPPVDVPMSDIKGVALVVGLVRSE